MQSLPVIAAAPFTCPRTCPKYERRDVCRFNSLLAAVGVAEAVTSVTVTVRVAFKRADALAAAVRACGGDVIGFGTHKLFEREPVEGFGFRLPGWKFPLVATGSGSLCFDDYTGAWGSVADLERLKREYTLAAAEVAAAALGWLNERTPAGSVRVFHPSGGYLDVTSDGVDAVGFGGVGCHEAAAAIADAIGATSQAIAKPEAAQVAATIPAAG